MKRRVLIRPNDTRDTTWAYEAVLQEQRGTVHGLWFDVTPTHAYTATTREGAVLAFIRENRLPDGIVDVEGWSPAWRGPNPEVDPELAVLGVTCVRRIEASAGEPA